jgi:choline dehydrogenase-like flavoprotein
MILKVSPPNTKGPSAVTEAWGYPKGPLPVHPPRDQADDRMEEVVDGRNIDEALVLRTQVLVIGSGAGGAVVAAELAQQGVEVLILEQGGYHTRETFHDSPLSAYLKMYENGGLTATLGRPSIALPYGRAVGGTTIINSGTCLRVPPWVLSRWADLGLDQLSMAKLAPHYESVEARLHIQPVTKEIAGENCDIVQRGAETLGLSGGYLPRNARGCVGSGRCVFGCPSGAKQSMERTYLPDALAHGAKLYAHCRSERILFEREEAVGVQARTTHGQIFQVRCKHLVLAAGAIGSPLLLQHNRLGGKHVGRHLHIHPAGKVIALMDKPVQGQGVPQSYYVDDLHEDGIMLEGAYVPPEFSSIAMPHFGRKHAQLMNESARLATFGIMVTDTGSGRVRPGPSGRARIHYALSQTDAERFKRGMILCAQLFFTAGAEKLFLGLPKLEILDSVDDISKLESYDIKPTDLELAAFHPMGTCRIGSDPQKSVVDQNMTLHGWKNISVADASVMPSSIGVNPQLTIMALGMRAAHHILSRVRT